MKFWWFGVLVLGMVFIAGWGLVNFHSFQTNPVDQSMLAQVKDLIQTHYFQSINLDSQLTNPEALVANLPDRYSQIYSPEESIFYGQLKAGIYQGIGMSFDWVNGQVLVYQVLPNSPAFASGLEPQDVIASINGKPTIDMTKAEIEQALRLKVGEQVQLEIKRQSQFIKMDIAAAEFDFKTVEYRQLEPTLGYIHIYTFGHNTQQELETVVAQILAEEITHLVIDLRGNNGGVSESSLAFANELIDEGGYLVIHKFRDSSRDDAIKSNGDGRLTNLKLVALVDRFTASEAEILVAALKDNGRAYVVGEPTYGKGLTVTHYPLSDGRILQLATAEWLRPNGESVEGVGIEPTVNSQDIIDWQAVPWRSVW